MHALIGGFSALVLFAHGPACAQEAIASVPTKLQVVKDGDFVTVTPSAFEAVKVTVSKGKATGISVENKMRHKGKLTFHGREEKGGIGFDLSFDFTERVYAYMLKKFPYDGEDYIWVYSITVFEADARDRRLLSSRKVLWTKTFEEVVKLEAKK